jgi:hypothetical protein
LLARTLARLRRYADAYDAPVLLTRSGEDGNAFGGIVANCADHRLRCERTPQGPRFVGDDDEETLVYPQPDGTLQTTLAYWRTILDRRATAAGVDVDGPTLTVDAGATGALGSSSLGSSTASPGRFGDASALASSGRGHDAAHERALSPWRGGA